MIGNSVRTASIAILLSCAAAVSAFAADMGVGTRAPRGGPLGAPPPRSGPPVVAAPSWSGCHVGVSGGGIKQRSAPVPILGDTATTESQVLGNVPLALHPDPKAGWLLGGAVGCDIQFSNIVVGVEGDLSYVNGAKSFDTVTQGFATVTTQYGERFGWLGTVRGRVGVAIDRVLVYGTGGFAAAEVKSNAIIFPAGVGPILAGNSSETRNGWTVGGGVEIAFLPGVTFKTEYLFVDLGRMQQVTNTVSGGAAQSAIFQHDKEAHVVRVGVNVQLQPPPPPPRTESIDTIVQGARVRF